MRYFLVLATLTALSVPLAAQRPYSSDADLRRALLAPQQGEVEAQVHIGANVKPSPRPASAAVWDAQSATIREQVLSQVVFRGGAAAWRRIPTKYEWAGELPGDGYKIRKFRYEVVPGMWLPGLLYEPANLTGKVPVVLNLNGHEGDGMANSYIQDRCIHLARLGMIAINYEWFQKGQMNASGFGHYRMNQLDLVGTSGLAPFFLATQRLIDIGLQHPNADPQRLAVTGLSGGGWQTILLSSLDTRVKAAMPVAGYSSYVTRTQYPVMDLGDSEQTPSDLAVYADYTHLTGLLAPRPAMLTHNALDNCCFRADYALSPLLATAQPIYALYRKSGNLRHHVNFDQGHNYGLENRVTLYRFLDEFFFKGAKGDAVNEVPKATDLRKSADFKIELPAPNADFHSIALRLSESLPKAAPAGATPAARRKALLEIVRWPQFTVTSIPVESAESNGVRITHSKLVMSGSWTVPAVEMTPASPKGTVLLVGDAGKAELGRQANAHLAAGTRVIAIDPFYFGEAKLGKRDFLYAMTLAAIGERPLGIIAGQIAASAAFFKAKYGDIQVESTGPRTGVAALIAAAAEPASIAGLKTDRSFTSLREVLRRDLQVTDAPELFCFGLLEQFDVPQLAALVAPRPYSSSPDPGNAK